MMRTATGRTLMESFDALSDDTFRDLERYLDTVTKKPIQTTRVRADTRLKNVLQDLQSNLDSFL